MLKYITLIQGVEVEEDVHGALAAADGAEIVPQHRDLRRMRGVGVRAERLGAVRGRGWAQGHSTGEERCI